MTRLSLLLAFAVVLLAVPSAASAASVTAYPSGKVAFRPGGGEINRLTVYEGGSGRINFVDHGAPVVARGDCFRVSRSHARCPGSRARILVRLGSLDDLAIVKGPVAADVRGENGDDRIVGGAGDDRLRGGNGDDDIRGRDGDDRIDGRSGDDELRGGDGDDYIRGRKGTDLVEGRDGDDYIRGDDGNDLLKGGGGRDLIRGGDDDDEIQGRDGDDRLIGGPGDDLLRGGYGDDFLRGADGEDRLEGRAGDDLLGSVEAGGPAQTQPDALLCGGGNDRARTETNDTVTDCEIALLWSDDLQMVPQPRIESGSATFAIFCGFAPGCSGTIVLTDVDGPGKDKALGEADFDLPRQPKGAAPAEVRVELSASATKRLERGTLVEVYVRPGAYLEASGSSFGYRAFMRGG